MSDQNSNFVNLILSNEREKCLLTTNELEVRRKEILAKLSSKVKNRGFENDRYMLIFPNEDQLSHDLLDFILKEQNCCSFFQFSLNFYKSLETIALAIKSDSVSNDVVQNIIDALI